MSLRSGEVDGPGNGPEAALAEADRFGLAAMGFHFVSKFDHFREPVPPFAVAPEESPVVAAAPVVAAVHDAGQGALVDALVARQSQRNFDGRSVPWDTVAHILWASYGVLRDGGEPSRRTVPSAGGLYPLRVVLLAQRVTGVEQGIFEFRPAARSLVRLTKATPPERPVDWFRTRHVDYDGAAGVIFLIARFDRVLPKYGERGYRYVLLEAGHAAQNACLMAAALGVAHVPIGGFDDDAVSAGLSLPEAEATVYSIVFGGGDARP
jgi:SagB-type dehydrogenase family enzyme